MNVRALLAGFAAIALGGGCISVDVARDAIHPELNRHIVEAVAAPQSPRVSKMPALGVRSFGARSRYDIRVVRREGPEHFNYLEFERWAEPPADTATDAVREGLASSGAFESVSAAGDALAVERYLDGYVLAFDLVKTAKGPWRARFTARLSLSDKDGRMLHSAVYDTKHDLPDDKPEGLGAAMSAAIGEAVAKSLADWTSVK